MIPESKICCIIITYNPDSGLLDLVNTMSLLVGRIIIVDNKSVKGVDFIEPFLKDDRVEIIWNDGNFGIARALNQGARLGIEEGFEWAITFDQDSKPNNNIIDIVNEVHTQYPEPSMVGAIGVNYVYKGHDSDQYLRDTREIYQIKDTLITSGCCMSLKVFEEVKGFREDLFIDHVDEEYSLRLKRNHKVSLLTTKPGMVHEVGDNRTLKLFGLTLRSSNHGPVRRFYMGRNQIILIKDYLLYYPYFALKSAVSFSMDIVKMIILDDHKTAKLSACLKGIVIGLFYSSRRRKYYE